MKPGIVQPKQFSIEEKNNLKREKKVRVEKLFITAICYNIYKVCKL